MDHPDLTGVFDLRGYTSQIFPHPVEANTTEVVFFKEGAAIGTILFLYNGEEVLLGNLFLHESEQGKGLLTAIFAETSSTFRKAGFKSWAIDIDPESDLGQMYQKLGFQEVDGRLEGKIGSAGKLEKTAKARLKKGGVKP